MKIVKNLLFIICVLVNFQNILHAMGQNPITDIHSQMHVQNPQLYLRWAERYFGDAREYAELTDDQQKLMTERVSAIRLPAIIEENYDPDNYTSLFDNTTYYDFNKKPFDDTLDYDLNNHLETTLKPFLHENDYNKIVEQCRAENKKRNPLGAFFISKNEPRSAGSFLTLAKLLFGYSLKEWKTKWWHKDKNPKTNIELDNWSEFLPNEIQNKFLSYEQQKFNNYRLQAQAEIGSYGRFNTLFKYKCLYSAIGGFIGLAFGCVATYFSPSGHNQAIIGSTTSIGTLIGAIRANQQIDSLEKKEIYAINKKASELYKQDHPDCNIQNIVTQSLTMEPQAQIFRLATTKDNKPVTVLQIKPEMKPSNLPTFNVPFKRKFSAQRQIDAWGDPLGWKEYYKEET